MAFSRTWNTAYEASPANTDDISKDAQVARFLKIDLRERLEIDHSWAGDAHDGKHKTATMVKRGSTPTAAADNLILFTKDYSDKLYGVDPDGTVHAIGVPVGAAMSWTGSSEPPGWIFADARTIGDTGSGADHEGPEFEQLFEHLKAEGAAFGNTGSEVWGDLDTVKVPDIRDRVEIGAGTMGNSDAGRISNETTALGDTGGEDEHALTVSEMPTHSHGGSTGGNKAADIEIHTSATGSAVNEPFVTIDTAAHNINWRNLGRDNANHAHSISAEGGGSAHNNLQPFIVLNKIIKY